MPAVSTISVEKCILRNRIILRYVPSMVASCLSIKLPSTNLVVSTVLPVPLKPTTASLRCTCSHIVSYIIIIISPVPSFVRVSDESCLTRMCCGGLCMIHRDHGHCDGAPVKAARSTRVK